MSARHQRRGDRAARQAKVRQIADVLREGEPSRFRYEAACRHGLRAKLCLDGWPYHAADQEAHQLVQAALDMLGARRPSWLMAQPEWTHDGVRYHERETCQRCGKPLPERQRRYCSELCNDAASKDRTRRQNRQDYNAYMRSYNAAWSAKQPDRTCEKCGGTFKPKKPSRPNQRFCSRECARSAAGGRKH